MVQQQQNQGALPSNQGGSISLSMLIDFIVQRTYHDLTVLAELLPRKTDMERKIGELILLLLDDFKFNFCLYRNLQLCRENSSVVHQIISSCEMG